MNPSPLIFLHGRKKADSEKLPKPTLLCCNHQATAVLRKSSKMPGRQAHGRSLIAAPKAKNVKKSKARSQKNALDAFGIAQENFSARDKRTPRARQLDAEIDRKHARDDEDEDEEEEEEAPRRKKVKAPSQAAENDGAEYGSDSEGNEWQLGGLAEDDNDSEIESDEAFGESDDERFQGYAFRGTKSKDQVCVAKLPVGRAITLT
jgi:U3 small nucleolar RNA-associated protein 14